MIILGIETSCDETAAAVLKQDTNGIQILSNIVASSASLQAKYGGIIPEQAAREQIKAIIPVIEESLQLSGYSGQEIDTIAVTYGPGLIGSLLVGVETAKVLATTWKKPLIPVNHLIGHFYANWIVRGDGERDTPLSARSEQSESRTSNGAASRQDPEQNIPAFPCLGLLVSGGHTDLVLFTNHGKYKYLGGTRDDAAGECFDKCARLLGLPYPGGPQLSKLAERGNPYSFNLPRPMITEDNFDFSFSGLKTAVANLVKSEPQIMNSKMDLCASIEQAIVDVLVEKTIKAAQKYQVDQIMVAGGVAANQTLVNRLQRTVNSMNPKIKLYIPPANLCTDNGAMIAAAGFFTKQTADPLALQANSNLSLS